MEGVEHTIIVIAIQMGKIRQPLNVKETIQVANDLIKKTDHQAELVEFQKARHLGTELFKHGSLTKNWWLGFMRRHGHKIVTNRGERFACNRAEWTTLPNIKQMYDVLYDEFVDARIAVTLDEPVFTDKEGTVVVDKDEAFG